jgi:Flp pilus assembly protein TadD
MTCNTPLMNSWHSFSPNGRWLVFSSKSRSPYTQMFLTHINVDGADSPPILIDNATAANRAVNIPEFVNIPPDGLQKLEAPATDFFRVFDRALDLTKKNETEAAEAEWRKAVSLNPEDGKARFNLALSLDQRGQLDEAITHYQKAVEVEPDNAAAFTNLAVALLRKGRLDDAIDRFTKSIAIEPDNAKAQSNLGAALIQKGRVDEAIEHCRKALAVDPAYPDAHNSLGIGLAMRGKVDEAIPHLETAVAAAPDSLEYRYNLGRVLAAKRRFPDAIPHLEEAVKLSHGAEPQSLNMLSAMYGEVGRFADASQVARRALDIAVKENDTRAADALRARIAAYDARARQ